MTKSNESNQTENERHSSELALNYFVIRWMWEETTKPMLGILFAALFLIFSVFLVMGPMFGIAALIDAYSAWWLLAYIPWMATLPLTGKPLGMFLKLIG